MGGSDMPYLYEPTSNRKTAYPYSDFNPKAVTEASYERLSHTTLASQLEQRKQKGPLINFNQHPDSYMFVSDITRPKDFTPMPSNTKKTVVILRWVQFSLRLVEEIGALGLLAATICFQNTSGVETYLIRIPQAWDALITLYAIYHLVRPAKARIAANQAAYHIWALIMDVALIPLYIYVFLAAHANYLLPLNKVDAAGDQVGNRWISFFTAPADTDMLMTTTYIGAAAMCGLHLMSCAFDLALIILFRKISNLPPDLNPLEDNLTSRGPRTSKHKHKNSELTLNSDSCLSDAEKKRMAHLSGSTINIPDPRVSRTSLANRSTTSFDDRTIPFGHSRNNSTQTYSPHNPESARWSRHQFEGQQEVYREAAINRRSRYEIRPDGKLEVRSRRESYTPNKRDTMTETIALDVTAPISDDRRAESPPLSSYILSDRAALASPAVPNAAESNSVIKSQQKQGLLNNNWYVLEDDASDMAAPSRERTPAPELKHLVDAHLVAHERHDSFEPAQVHVHPKPLGMNPPTPPTDGSDDGRQNGENGGDGVNRTLTAASNITASSSVYSESAPSLQTANPTSPQRAGTPKGKYYGDLAAATRGVRGSAAPAGLGQYGMPSPQPSRSPSPEKKVRVISRTGADIADESAIYGNVTESKFAMRNRRDVSGKVAEEGRGGTGRGGGRMRRGDWVD